MNIPGTYGSNFTPCDIFTYDNGDETSWYCIEGSKNVNLCSNEYLKDDVDVETIPDFDCFAWSSPIESVDELESAVNY